MIHQYCPAEKLSELLGYIFSYLLFTTILFFILIFLNKLPQAWSFFHIIILTLLISLVGIMLNKFLK